MGIMVYPYLIMYVVCMNQKEQANRVLFLQTREDYYKALYCIAQYPGNTLQYAGRGNPYLELNPPIGSYKE
jgi:hypothetical protein